MSGRAVIASTTVRTVVASLPPTSVMYTAVARPSGRAIATAIPTSIAEPATACTMPPWVSGDVGRTPAMSLVKKFRWLSAGQAFTKMKPTVVASVRPTTAAPPWAAAEATRSTTAVRGLDTPVTHAYRATKATYQQTTNPRSPLNANTRSKRIQTRASDPMAAPASEAVRKSVV